MNIGTCIRGEELLTALPEVMAVGFESAEVYFPGGLRGADLPLLARKARDAIGDQPLTISSIGIYVNPLQSEEARREVEACIDAAPSFGAGVVSTFAGAIEGAPVFAAMPRFTEVFGSLVRRAEDRGVRIGLENAHMNGHWYRASCNIAFCPRAWEMIFDALPSTALGLTWEPSHQLEQFIDVYAQLQTWLERIVHIHGKDARVDRAAVARYGAWFGEHYCDHKFPGLGDTDWRRIIATLQGGHYPGDITIEGFHDPEFAGSREMEGQKLALDYLRRCRESI